MADSLALSHAAVRAFRVLPYQPSRLSWIKRRTRRLQNGFSVPRRIALDQAVTDWSQFQPLAVQ